MFSNSFRAFCGSASVRTRREMNANNIILYVSVLNYMHNIIYVYSIFTETYTMINIVTCTYRRAQTLITGVAVLNFPFRNASPVAGITYPSRIPGTICNVIIIYLNAHHMNVAFQNPYVFSVEISTNEVAIYLEIQKCLEYCRFALYKIRYFHVYPRMSYKNETNYF